MGLGSKRKSPWRHRCWHKVFLALVGIPTTLGVILLAILLTRAFFMLPNTEVTILQNGPKPDFVDDDKTLIRAERLAGALRIPTVSYEADNQEKQAILKLHQYLEKSKYFG